MRWSRPWKWVCWAPSWGRQRPIGTSVRLLTWRIPSGSPWRINVFWSIFNADHMYKWVVYTPDSSVALIRDPKSRLPRSRRRSRDWKRKWKKISAPVWQKAMASSWPRKKSPRRRRRVQWQALTQPWYPKRAFGFDSRTNWNITTVVSAYSFLMSKCLPRSFGRSRVARLWPGERVDN